MFLTKNKNSKLMCLHRDDDKLLENYKIIWAKVVKIVVKVVAKVKFLKLSCY